MEFVGADKLRLSERDFMKLCEILRDKRYEDVEVICDHPEVVRYYSLADPTHGFYCTLCQTTQKGKQPERSGAGDSI